MFGKGFITILLSCSLVISPVYSASWVNEWVGSAIVNTPTEFTGDREYGMTFGRFSSRIKTETINPISVYPPRLQIGGACGGIDFFAGGLSFMNPEYLLDKLRGAVAGAPAALFLLALSQFCPSCEKTISTIESIANQINQLQFNECQMRQRIVAVLADKFNLKKQQEETQKQALFKETIQHSNLKKAEEEVRNKINNNDDLINNNMCFRDPSLINSLKEGRSLLKSLQENLNLSVTFDNNYYLSEEKIREAIKFIENFVSDYRMNNQGIIEEYRVKCSSENFLNYIKQGYSVTILNDQCRIVENTPTNSCVWNSSSTNISNYVFNCMNSIKSKTIMKQPLNEEEKRFLNFVRDYDLVYGAIFSEITKRDLNAIKKISSYLAMQIALNIVNDALLIFDTFLNSSYLEIKNSVNRDAILSENCRTEKEAVEKLQEAIMNIKNDLNDIKANVLNEYSNFLSSVQSYISLRKTLIDEHVDIKFKIYNMLVGRAYLKE